MRAHTLIVAALLGALATVADTTPPTTPAGLRVTTFTANSVTLAWNPSTAPTLSVAYLAPVRAAVAWTRSTDDTSFSITYTLHANGAARSGDIRHNLGQTMLGLSPGTRYALQVSARDPYGNTSWSNTVTVTTPAITDTTPPAAPSSLGGRADVGSSAPSNAISLTHTDC